MKGTAPWRAIQKVLESGKSIDLKHFRPVKPLGSGDTGSVHLVELLGTAEYFAMKAMDKSVMLNRNKVHRATAERQILDMLDHPFLPKLYASFQGGELFLLLDRQPTKVLKEDEVRRQEALILLSWFMQFLCCRSGRCTSLPAFPWVKSLKFTTALLGIVDLFVHAHRHIVIWYWAELFMENEEIIEVL